MVEFWGGKMNKKGMQKNVLIFALATILILMLSSMNVFSQVAQTPPQQGGQQGGTQPQKDPCKELDDLKKNPPPDCKPLEDDLAAAEEALKSNRPGIEKEIGQLKSTIAGKESQLKQLEDRLKELEAKANEDGRITEEEQSAIDRLKRAIEARKAELEKLKADLEAKENELKALEQAVEDAKKALEDCKQKKIDYENELKRLDALCKASKAAKGGPVPPPPPPPPPPPVILCCQRNAAPNAIFKYIDQLPPAACPTGSAPVAAALCAPPNVCCQIRTTNDVYYTWTAPANCPGNAFRTPAPANECTIKGT